MPEYSKNKFCGTITKIYDKKEGNSPKQHWELVTFSVKAKFYRTFNLWHDTDEFLNNFHEGDEVIVFADEYMAKETKDNVERWVNKYNVEKVMHLEGEEPKPKEPEPYKKPENPYMNAQNQFGITDDDLPF
jgi:hypothetical protein